MDSEIAWWIFTLSGLVVGIIVGITGVGGGSLMTPILIGLGIPAIKAVATDLLYAAFTKAGGILAHQKNKTIDWEITGWMILGSVASSLMTLYVMSYYNLNGTNKETEKLIKITLAIALIITSITIMVKHKINFKKINKNKVQNHAKQISLTVILGFFIGILVTISSIGAGAIGTVILFMLYPTLSTKKIVGTDIAHAVPLTFIAGTAHSFIGNEPIHWEMLGYLLLGSLPGIYFGSHFGGKVSDKILKPILAGMLFIIALTMLKPYFY